MDEAVVERILGCYGLDFQRILLPQKGYRNTSYPIELKNGQQRNLILYKRELGMRERIVRANAVADFVAGTGMPARATDDPRIIHMQASNFEKYGSLYTYLPGSTIPWEAYTKDHIKLVGMAMSTMHARLATNISDTLSPVADEYQVILEQMRHYFTAPVRQALAAKLYLTVLDSKFATLALALRCAKSLPHQQTLHMDFVRGNLLFAPATAADTLIVDDTALSGILDFEKTAYGHPLFDIARTLAFLLVDCPKPDEKIRKYFLESGYQKRGEANFTNIVVTTKAEKVDLLESLLDLFLLYDFYKFLRHNPYEFLDQNHHFVRTRDILLARGMIE